MRIFILLMLLMQGCTSYTYTGSNGETLSYWSTKDIKATVIKTGDDFEIEINADNEGKEVVESISRGVVEGMGLTGKAGGN